MCAPLAPAAAAAEPTWSPNSCMMQFDQRRPHIPLRERETFRHGCSILHSLVSRTKGPEGHKGSSPPSIDIVQRAYWNNFSSCAHGLGQLVIYEKRLTDGNFRNIPQDLRDTNGDLNVLQALQGPEKQSPELRYMSEYTYKVCATQ